MATRRVLSSILRSSSGSASAASTSPSPIRHATSCGAEGIYRGHGLFHTGSPIAKEGPFYLPRRSYHIELGAREKALLEEDPALKKFKSYKNTVKQVSKIGDALTILVVAACSYEIYAVATKRKEQTTQD